MDADNVYFMRHVRIRKSAVIGIRPTRDGMGTMIVTKDAGKFVARRVDEHIATVLFFLYDIDVSMPEGGAR